MPYLNNAGTFLISTLFDLYILIVMLRFLFQLLRADFYNPIAQFTVRATNPPLRILRRWIPGTWGIDLPSIVLMLMLKALGLWLLATLGGYHLSAAGLALLAVVDLLRLALNVFLISIFIQVILSWIAPRSHSPATTLLHSLTEPLLGPARRLIPPIGGLDLSPIGALIALQLVSMTLIAWLHDVARTLA